LPVPNLNEEKEEGDQKKKEGKGKSLVQESKRGRRRRITTGNKQKVRPKEFGGIREGNKASRGN